MRSGEFAVMKKAGLPAFFVRGFYAGYGCFLPYKSAYRGKK